VTVSTNLGPIEAGAVISSGGLHADRFARSAGADVSDVRIVPFRWDDYILMPESGRLVKGLIYSVPDLAVQLLGVHLTRMVNGEVEAGPNAVFAFAREGYQQLDVKLGDVADAVAFPGLWRMASRFWKIGGYEMYRSFSKAAFVRA